MPLAILPKRTLRGYIANNSLTVRIKDIGKAGTLAQQMLDKGANRFDGIAYQYSQKEEKIDSLRGDAVRDAMRKANSYVKALGIRLGRVLEIASQPHDAAAPAQEAALVIPVEPGVETLRTEVQVTWELAED
jgi:uncharacterized protein